MKLIVILETGNAYSNYTLNLLIHSLTSPPVIGAVNEESIVSSSDNQEIFSLESLLFDDINNNIELHIDILNANQKSKRMLKRNFESKLKFYKSPIGTKHRLKFIPAGHRA